MIRKEPALVLGGVASANLLPPEIRAMQRAKAVLRALIGLVVVVTAVVGMGVAIASVQAIGNQVLLQSERMRGDRLLAEQQKYAEARQISLAVITATMYRQAATVPEVDWKALLDQVAATLPAGVSITSIDVAMTVDQVEAGAEVVPVPLQEDSVATVTLKARSLSVPDVEAWLDDLETIDGFAGIAPPATVEGTAETGYDVGLQLLIGEDAYLGRFATEEEN